MLRRWRELLAVCCAGALLSGIAPLAADATAPSWLTYLNMIRASSGLAAVSNMPSWSGAIQAHLTYLRRTPASMKTGPYASAHTENPASPYYTAAGAREAASSDLTFYSSSDVAALNVWLGAPLHAIGLLRPALLRVAFARDPSSGYAGLDVIRGLGAVVQRAPVLYPGPGATTNLKRFTGEVPSVLPTCGYRSAGLILVAMLARKPASVVSVQLRTPLRSQLSTAVRSQLCTVTAANFRSNDRVYGGGGKTILSLAHAILIVPAQALTDGVYNVRLIQSGQRDISWSFRVT